MAATAAFLASDDSAYITGETTVVAPLLEECLQDYRNRIPLKLGMLSRLYPPFYTTTKEAGSVRSIPL